MTKLDNLTAFISRAALWTFAVGVVLLGSATARAENLAVAVSSELRLPIHEALEKAARTLQWTIVPVDDTAGHSAALAECYHTGVSCLADTASVFGADYVLLVEATETQSPEGNTWIELTGYLIHSSTGQVQGTERRYCERCWDSRLDDVAAVLVAALLGHAGSTPADRAFIEVRSTPSGARVLVDGEAVGATELRYGLVPGAHVIEIKKPGYRTAVRRIDIRAGQTETIDVVLQAEGGPSGGKGATFGLWKWLALGGGAAAVAGGVVLVSIDGPRVEDGVRQRHERGTMASGVAVTVVGAALIATGILMWRSDRRAEHRAGAGSAAVVPTGDGALFVIAGEF